MSREFVFPCRVYWEDTDAGGVVYYANYLKFMERARTEWLRAMGIEQTPLREQYGVLLVVAKVEASYRRPARYGDLLQVSCRIIEQGKASLSFAQNIYRGESHSAANSELLLEGITRVGCIDADSFRPRSLPPVIVQALNDFQQQNC